MRYLYFSRGHVHIGPFVWTYFPHSGGFWVVLLSASACGYRLVFGIGPGIPYFASRLRLHTPDSH